VRGFLRRLKVFTLAESLGGVESLVDHPASMTHASVPKRERGAHGVTDGLVRFSCGIEDPADLADAVRRALRGT
jgi:cystathionine beta-lyase/cystathionine gamma-synthase